MKSLVLAFICISLLVGCSATEQKATSDTLPTLTGDDRASYSLDWKLGTDEVVAYKTAMNRVEETSSTISLNIDQFLSDSAIPNELNQKLSNLQLPEVSSLISVLEQNARGNISVRMILNDVRVPEAESDDELSQMLNQMMQEMEGTVQLRGELTPDGAIASFYLEQQQRNLLAIFFELPTGTVQVGDSWELDFNCLALGAGFVADNANRMNRVSFTSLSHTPDGKPVAILDYVLLETVAGNFHSPMSDEDIPTSMTCSFLGRGEFLIEQGRWQQLNGEFSLTSTGIMQANTIQQFALLPLDNIPENLESG